MRLLLATALLVICICSQGCASFLFFGKSPNRYSAKRKTLSTIFGMLSGPILVASGACIADGKAQMDKYPHNPEKWEYAQGQGTMMGGILLSIPGLACGILSMIFGYQHYQGRATHGLGGTRDDSSAPWQRGYSEGNKDPARALVQSSAFESLKHMRYVKRMGLRVLLE
ncbi:MAG: hypothetical protein ACYTFG_15635 [Planctomycetota bacterium]|jgi:hypothetical protein